MRSNLSLSDRQLAEFESQGFVLLKQQIPEDTFTEFESHAATLLSRLLPSFKGDLHSPETAQLLLGHREVERQFYDKIREYPWLINFCSNPNITAPVIQLLGDHPTALLEKIPYRIDLPMMTRELAVWHQDFHYVKGNTETITAWIPCQETRFINGALMIMPESHKLGSLTHENHILGKRHFPSGIFDHTIRYVEMDRGDVLLFHSLLLHSSSLNFSETCRYSMQARYTPLKNPSSPGMGKKIPIDTSTK